MKRKIAGILLFFCLVAPLAATYTWLHYRLEIVRKSVKRQILAGLDDDELVLLKFSTEAARTELDWEHRGEFKYRNQKYDLVRLETCTDSIYYWCWLDHEETLLEKQLDQLLSGAIGDDGQSRTCQERLAQFFKSLYFAPISSPPEAGQRQATAAFAYLPVLHSIDLAPQTPPPKSLLY